MGRYQYLVAVPPQPLCQLNANLMGKLRGSFSGSERLIAMVSEGSTLLTKAPLDHEHFFPRSIRVAVDPRNKTEHDGLFFIAAFFDGFPLLHSIIDNVRQIPFTARGRCRIGCGWICCFLWIFGVVNDFSQAAPYTPDRCCSQYGSPSCLPGKQYRRLDFLNRLPKFSDGFIVVPCIDGTQRMGF